MDNNYIKNKLLQNKVFSDFCSAMKEGEAQLWLCGGAITAVATGGVINDYDIYFKTKEDCVKGIQYMKEQRAHVAFVSDKSITYVIGNSSQYRNALGEYESHTTIQFIFYDYYETPEDVFCHFDFTCNFGAYDILSGEFSFHKDFWLHNSQRFLSFNPKTKFPLISGLRVEKYKSKGYTTSRTEMMKIMFACASLRINSWEEFSNQVGNLYGFNFISEEDWNGKDFSMENAMEILSGTDFSEVMYTPQSSYKHPVDLLEYLVADKPILRIESNGKVYFPDVDSDEVGSVLAAVDEEVLTVEDTTLKDYLGEFVYCWLEEDGFELNTSTENRRWGDYYVYKTKEDVKSLQNTGLLVKCKYEEEDLTDCSLSDYRFKQLLPVEIMCDKGDVLLWKNGKDVPPYKPRVKVMKSDSFSCAGFTLGCHTPTPDYISAKFREDHIRAHVKITGGESKYAHKTFVGHILKGGEDITAKELLLFVDSYCLCFGGSCTILANGKFSGQYNTD